jgi:hypothetical protein
MKLKIKLTKIRANYNEVSHSLYIKQLKLLVGAQKQNDNRGKVNYSF